MKANYLIVLPLLGLISINSVHAEEPRVVEEPQKNPDDRSKVESWYFNLGMSYVRNGYGKSAQSAVSAFNTVSSNSTSLSLALGLEIGVYFPITNTIALGITDSGLVDVYVSSGVSSSLSSTQRTLSISQSFIGPSAQFFLSGDFIGSGFYVRTDAGLSYFQIANETKVGTTTTKSDDFEFGYGFQGGIGYGIPTSPGARILLDALYSYRSSASYSSGALTIGISMLF